MSAFKDWLNGLTSKTTPVDADELYVRDSSGTPGSKKLTWANLKATLANTFLSLTGGTLAGGTRTTSGSTLTITETLNNAGVTFPGALVVDVTDTASATGSLLADLKVGGVSKFRIPKEGGICFTGGAFDSFSIMAYGNSYGELSFGVNGSVKFTASALGIFSNGIPIGASWGGYLVIDADNDGTNSVRLYRDANHTLAQRNGTNAQTYRNYGTYTDASNYRRVAIAMTTAGVASITPEGAGTGASGNVLHISGLPTSNPGAGILWNDSGTVKVGT
jgi:hypothetical protein